MTHLDRPPSLLRNDSTGGSWLTVVPIDRHGVRSPIGTLVTITAGGRRQFRDIAAGDSYMSTHDPRPHFGLGDASDRGRGGRPLAGRHALGAHAGQAAPVPDNHAINVVGRPFSSIFHGVAVWIRARYYSVGPHPPIVRNTSRSR